MSTNRQHIYSIEELIDNQSFINWVLERANNQEFEYWTAYTQALPGEQQTLQEAGSTIRAIVHKDREVSDEVLANVRKKISSSMVSSSRPQFFLNRKLMTMAATVIGLIVACIFLFSRPTTTVTTVTTVHHEMKTINLPDGSEVLLNAGSRLSYEISSYKKSDRILHLHGHAFFKVEKGKPFIVKTDQGDIEVLGTSFDVYDRADGFSVACKTGSVQVTNKYQDSVILSPGEEVNMPDTKMNKIQKGLDKIGCWGKGTFYYKAINLRRILDEVERQFDTKIVCQPAGLGDQLYSGYFINTHLDSALMSICWPLRIQYEHQDKNIIVSRK